MVDRAFSGSMMQLFWETLFMDRMLRDPSSVWGYINPENGGVRDANVSQQYYQDFLKAHSRKEAAYTTIPGTSYELGKDENGSVVLKGSSAGYYEFTPATWTQFLRVAMSLQPGADPNTTAGFGGQSHSPTQPQFNDDRPIMQKRFADSMKELERLALASSKSFPNSK
jgi:hypothetical protein